MPAAGPRADLSTDLVLARHGESRHVPCYHPSRMSSTTSIDQQVKAARLPFAAMTGCYSAGVFNDNFFKQSSMLIAVGLGLTHLQGWLAASFILPYLLLAAPAGWLADRFSKRHVVVGAKSLELVAMLLGAAGIYWLSWPLVLAMAFVMGLQSCIFSPAMNGSIPELYPESHVTGANSVLKATMIAAVLAGIALAGVVLESGGAAVGNLIQVEPELGRRVAVAVGIVLVAVVGLVASFGTPERPAADPRARLPWAGPVDTLREIGQMGQDRALLVAALLGTFVWSVGSLQAMLINPLGSLQFGFGETRTAGLLAVEMVGVAVGGGLAGVLARGPRWQRLLVPTLVVMALLLTALVALPFLPPSWRYGVAAALLGAGGVAGGLVLIPCEAFVQVRPSEDRRGAVLGAYGFLFGGGVLASALLANLLNWLVEPTWGFAITGGLTLVLALVVAAVLPRQTEEG